MGFYKDWNSNAESGSQCCEYIKKFINNDQETISPLISGEERELQAAYEVLSSTPIHNFFTCMDNLTVLPPLTAADIPCFSNMENGACRINELLEFSSDGLTFEQIGYKLIKSVNKGAKVKYGENQAKLAQMMDLVYFKNTRPIVVLPTAWGEFLTGYKFSEKTDIMKKLLLRGACVKNILCPAFKGSVNYKDAAAFLSKSTMVRRRTNVRYLITFILTDTDRETALSNIDWKVEEN